jgi:DNA polymerase III delta subunit
VPAVTSEALRKQIASRRLAPIYVLVGDDVRRIEELVSAIEATIEPADQPFAVDRLYAGDEHAGPVDIVDSARVLPMLGDRRIVIVMRAERFLKPKRAVKAAEGVEAPEPADAESAAADLAALEAYVEAPASSATLVLVAAEIDRTRRLTKLLAQKAQVLELSGLEGDDAMERRQARAAAARQIGEELRGLGRSIDSKALEMLVERAGGDISKLRDDVERLLLYTEGQSSISRSDVEEVAAAATNVDDEFGVVNAMADRNVKRALTELAARLDRGDSVHALLGQIRWWVSARLSGMAPDRVKPAIDAVLRTDLALKSSGGDERVLVERLVVELTGR